VFIYLLKQLEIKPQTTILRKIDFTIQLII